ncbi:MAG: CsbD family protein [Desulfuromonadales bacterium]|nr:CsbD family protein [Desulfuromonadales bacterium]MDW7758184.1 CsbD family protein [Desulfuromonadales bacterium]
MKSGNRDKAEGAMHQTKGKIKEVVGKLTDNPRLEDEGTSEKVAGKVQRKVGEVKKVLDE